MAKDDDKQKLERALEALNDAKAKLQEQNDTLSKLAQAGHIIGTVTDLRGDRLTVDGKWDLAAYPDAKVGDVVAVLEETHQVMGVIKESVPAGVVASVREAHDRLVEIEIDGQTRAVRSEIKVQPGERVVVDQSMSAILTSLGMPKNQAFMPKVKVAWDDIGGQDDAKAQLREAIEMPMENKELFAKYGKKPVKGVLLFGPPGNGKTLLAKAAATAIARLHGAEDGAEGFTYVKGPELLSKWVGETEASIRAMFTASREHFRKKGYPAVVFLDECDALLGKRGDGGSLSTASLTVPQFLSEMDGLEETGAIFILATNRPDALDEAVVRPGRIDRKVKVGRPDQKTAKAIIDIHLRGRPVKGDDYGSLAEWSAQEVFDPKRIVKSGTVKGKPLTLTLSNVVSGAVLAEIVEQASTRALLRDAQAKSRKCSGICQDDMSWAMDQQVIAAKETDNSSAIKEALGAA